MYDRRIDGEEVVFGNQGALYKNAMTWWDHGTESVWSQVTGSALYGPLEGTELRQIPAAVETWGAWSAAHPGTLVLETPEGFDAEPVDPDFVISVAIGDEAAGYRFEGAVERRVVNDEIGGLPLAVYARPDHLIRVYGRSVGGRTVELRAGEGTLVDPATGTAWDAATGRGIGGPLSAHPLHSVAWTPSFDWAWLDFHPQARIVE